MQWHQMDHMQTICTSLQTDNHTNTSSVNFYRPDALPDAQPTVSKHWRRIMHHIATRPRITEQCHDSSYLDRRPACNAALIVQPPPTRYTDLFTSITLAVDGAVRATDAPVKVVSADGVDGVLACAVKQKSLSDDGASVTLHLMSLAVTRGARKIILTGIFCHLEENISFVSKNYFCQNGFSAQGQKLDNPLMAIFGYKSTNNFGYLQPVLHNVIRKFRYLQK